MSKLLSGVFAAVMVVALAAGGGSAQDKKDTKKDGKGAKAAAAVVEVSEGKDGKFRFSVRDAEGKYLGGSAVGYATKDDATKAYEALKAALPGARVEYPKKDDKK